MYTIVFNTFSDLIMKNKNWMNCYNHRLIINLVLNNKTFYCKTQENYKV